MSITRRQILIILPAAALSWKYLLAGTPEIAPNYNQTDHWWGMLIDIPKCIGCGNCVRACKTENNVPDGYFRTWVERYHVDDFHVESPIVDSPDGAINGFPESREHGGKNFFVPKMCNHCVDSPCTQVCPVGATFDSQDGVVLIGDARHSHDGEHGARRGNGFCIHIDLFAGKTNFPAILWADYGKNDTNAGPRFFPARQ
jgi:ferredoxin